MVKARGKRRVKGMLEDSLEALAWKTVQTGDPKLRETVESYMIRGPDGSMVRGKDIFKKVSKKYRKELAEQDKEEIMSLIDKASREKNPSKRDRLLEWARLIKEKRKH